MACIYGAAGTGKSTLAKHISNVFPDLNKLYLSNTNPSVMNMYRKIGGVRNKFMTITSYLKNPNSCDILFIDECSTVSNLDMKRILELNKFKYLVLLGDIYQIQSIKYGTWFKFAKGLLKGTCKHELKELRRTTKPHLSLLWETVRKKEDFIDEVLSENASIRELDDSSLFEKSENQITLGLNYDGLYGINNINQILQSKNQSESFKIGSFLYKINDPILFTENNKYIKVLYNNLGGKITSFFEKEDKYGIGINVETNINSALIEEYSDLELIKINDNNTSDIVIYVDKEFDSDLDEVKSKLIPFQVAYAVTIHKAQGLEYSTVKIVISENLEEMLTHDIFYTAITRAKDELLIYWTQGTQERVLSSILKPKSVSDIGIFAKKFNLKIREKIV